MPSTESSNGALTQDMIVADRDGVITHWGADCAQAFGYTADEAVGQSVALIIPPVLHARHWRGFHKAVASGTLKREGATLKVPAVGKGGRVLGVRGTLALQRDAGGTVDAVALRFLGSGSALASSLWRAVLAMLRAGQSVAARVRGGVDR